MWFDLKAWACVRGNGFGIRKNVGNRLKKWVVLNPDVASTVQDGLPTRPVVSVLSEGVVRGAHAG